MAKFCSHCGNPLPESGMCNCKKAVAERQEPPTSTKNTQRLEEISTAMAQRSEETPVLSPVQTDPSPTPVSQESPTPPVPDSSPEPYPTYVTPPTASTTSTPLPTGYPSAEQPASFQVPSPVTQAAEQVSQSFQSFIKNPMKTIEHPDQASPLNGLILVGLNALSFVLFVFILFARSGVSGGFYGTFLYPILTVVIGATVLLGVVFIGAKMTQSTLSLNSTINIIGLGSIPGIAALVAGAVVVLLFGGISGFPAFLLVFLFVFAASFTTLLLERGLRAQIPSEGARIIILALAIALQFSIGALVLRSSFVSALSSAMSAFFYKEDVPVSNKVRCLWAEGSLLERDYHDHEWGRPQHHDGILFEKINLEAMQAGLSWSIILQKRDNFRAAFHQFDPEKIVLFNDAKINTLMEDTGIVRNRLKIQAVVNNAKAYLSMRDQGELLDTFLWRYVDGQTIQNRWAKQEDIPGFTPFIHSNFQGP